MKEKNVVKDENKKVIKYKLTQKDLDDIKNDFNITKNSW